MTNLKFTDLSPRMQKQALEQLAEDEERKKALLPDDEPKSKYRSTKTTLTLESGVVHTFDSKKEADTYLELSLRQKAGEISNLRLQVPFELIPHIRLSNGKMQKSCKYFADFVFEEDGKTVVMDVKSPVTRTPAYQIKKKLMKHVYDIEIVEV